MATRESKYGGFTIVEAIVVVAVVAVMGVTGWFVYQHNRPTDTKAASGSTPSNNQQTSTTPTTYFTINEWGVRAPYSGSLKLSYTLATDSTGNSSATFSSDQLSALTNYRKKDNRCRRRNQSSAQANWSKARKLALFLS